MAKQPDRPLLSIKAGAKRGAVKQDISPVAADLIQPTEDNSNIREVMATIEEAFNSLGTEKLPGTVIPTGQKNNAKEAAEAVIADRLVKLATDRHKKAMEAAEKAGVFGEPSSYIIGDTVMVFSDPNFSINVKMGRPSEMVGRKEVEAAAAEYLGKKASEFLDRCKKPRAATKQIIFSMK